MSKLVTNIIKGIIGRLAGMKNNNPYKLSWMQEKILKHQDDINEKKVVLKNIPITYKRPYEVLHTYKDIFENEIYKFKSNSAEPVIIDCGANIGISVIYFKHLYPASKIIAFEPDPDVFKILKKNVDIKNWNVDLHQSAVWIQNGTISFSANASEASHINEAEVTSPAALVKTERLADILASINYIDFLKVDIEGAEWKVMLDCGSELHKIQNMFIEYHGKVDEIQKLTDLLQLFATNGFSTYIKNATDNLALPFINKTTKTVYDVQLNIFCYKDSN